MFNNSLIIKQYFTRSLVNICQLQYVKYIPVLLKCNDMLYVIFCEVLYRKLKSTNFEWQVIAKSEICNLTEAIYFVGCVESMKA